MHAGGTKTAFSGASYSLPPGGCSHDEMRYPKPLAVIKVLARRFWRLSGTLIRVGGPAR